MVDPAVFAVFSLPVVVFVSAGIVEFRRDRQSLRSLRRLLPLAAALALSSLLHLFGYFFEKPDIVNRLSGMMSAASLLVGLSAFFAGTNPA